MLPLPFSNSEHTLRCQVLETRAVAGFEADNVAQTASIVLVIETKVVPVYTFVTFDKPSRDEWLVLTERDRSDSKDIITRIGFEELALLVSSETEFVVSIVLPA